MSEEASRPLARAPAGQRALHAGWQTNGGLFVLTCASVFVTLFFYEKSDGEATASAARAAAEFTASLLAILVAHEGGHYVAAKSHGVDASLPYFIPLPLVSPFGTMGAIIRMRGAIATRRALLDIGAAGPLAGLLLALPLYAWGVAHSHPLHPMPLVDANAANGGDGGELGTSLLLRALNAAFAPRPPDDAPLVLSPVAYAAWVGMFVTMINLLPAGQLDGGHVAYALLGERQNRVARWVHRSTLALFFVNVASFAARDVRAGLGLWHLGRHVYNSMFWLMWFEALAVLGSITSRRARAGAPAANSEHDGVPFATRAALMLGLAWIAWVLHDRTSVLLWVAFASGLAVLVSLEARWGSLRPASRVLEHPTTSAAPLPLARTIVGVITLAFFLLLFMPTPFVL